MNKILRINLRTKEITYPCLMKSNDGEIIVLATEKWEDSNFTGIVVAVLKKSYEKFFELRKCYPTF